MKLRTLQPLWPGLGLALLLCACAGTGDAPVPTALGAVQPDPEDTQAAVAGSEPSPGSKPSGMTVYTSGSTTWVSPATQLGIMMQGGGADCAPALKWMIGRSGGGDVVVLRTDKSSGYNSYIYSTLGGVNSVRTLVVAKRAWADSTYVEQTLKNAEMVFIAGGDQTAYHTLWNGTKLEAALHHLVNTKKVPVGGTSAGMAILGQFAYIPAGTGVISSEALANPYHANMANLKGDFLTLPFLAHTLTDTHWSERDRCGRTVTFLARLIQDGLAPVNAVRGIAADECAALGIDEGGNAKVFGTASYDDYVYFFKANSTPDRCASGQSLNWLNAVTVYKVKGYEDGRNTFNLGTWGGAGGSTHSVNVSAGRLSTDIQTPD